MAAKKRSAAASATRVPAVDFKKLKHAYGSASSIPKLIDQLAGEDAASHAAALRGLSTSLLAPGRWFSATPATISLLLDRALETGTPRRHVILALVARLVAAGTPTPRPLPEASTPSSAAAEARHDEVLLLLGDGDARVRAAAAMLLAALPAGREHAIPALERQLVEETDDDTRASLLVALATLGVRTVRPPASDDPLVLGAAAIAAGTLDESVEALLRPAPRDAERFPWHEGRTDLLALEYLPPEVIARGAVALGPADGPDATGALSLKDVCVAVWVARALSGVFSSDPTPRTPDSLDAPQRALLTTLSSVDVAGYFGGFGLPEGARLRRRFLGIDPAGPVDAIIEQSHDGEPHAWPIWRWLRALQPLAYNPFDPVQQFLEAHIEPGRRVGVLAEAALNHYGLFTPPAEYVVATIDRAAASGLPSAEWTARWLTTLGERQYVSPLARLSATLPWLRSGKPLDPSLDAIIPLSGVGIDAQIRELVAALPPPRLAALLERWVVKAEREPVWMGAALQYVVPHLARVPSLAARICAFIDQNKLREALGPFDYQPVYNRALESLRGHAKNEQEIANALVAAGLVP